MLTLHLIRHAKTHQVASSGKDKDRSLMDKGIAQANLLGHYIQAHHIGIGEIICSSATRTKQTASIIGNHLSEKHPIKHQDELYLADKEQLMHQLSNETKNTITIIGHNEGISELASYLTDEYIGMRTSEFITLTFSVDNWKLLSSGNGSISLRYRPEVFLP